MPRKGEYVRKDDLPVPREKYKARTLVEIRGWPHHQMRTGKKAHIRCGLGSNNIRKAYDRRRKMKRKIEQEIDEKAKELQALDAKVAEREKILDLASRAPTVKEMRGAVAALFKEENLDPIKEMIKMVKGRGKNALPAHQRAMLLKELAQYQAPKPKSVDVQADLDMNVSVGLLDFRQVGQKTIAAAVPAAEDEDYDEFEHKEEG